MEIGTELFCEFGVRVCHYTPIFEGIESGSFPSKQYRFLVLLTHFFFFNGFRNRRTTTQPPDPHTNGSDFVTQFSTGIRFSVFLSGGSESKLLMTLLGRGTVHTALAHSDVFSTLKYCSELYYWSHCATSTAHRQRFGHP